MTDAAKAPEGTAADLIGAGLRLFGAKGFAATSTREIAAEAGTNVASIAYHFGSKEGLRRACGAEVARRVRAVIVGPDAASPDAAPASTAGAVARMEAILRAVTAFVLTSSEGEPIVPFMLREVGEAGPVLDTVYAAMMDPMHRRFCALWATATGQEAESERTRLIVFTLLGQVLYFRIGRAIVTRRLGWEGLGPEKAATIADLLVLNLQSLLERERRP